MFRRSTIDIVNEINEIRMAMIRDYSVIFGTIVGNLDYKNLEEVKKARSLFIDKSTNNEILDKCRITVKTFIRGYPDNRCKERSNKGKSLCTGQNRIVSIEVYDMETELVIGYAELYEFEYDRYIGDRLNKMLPKYEELYSRVSF